MNRDLGNTGGGSTVTGTVFNIQRFSLSDGPGIRTTVFLKGCPLHCSWCHNPESQSARPEILYSPDQCIGCAACNTVCPENCHQFVPSEEWGKLHRFDRENCISCGKCTEHCYAKALERCGETRTVEEVLTEVLKDRAFYRNGGGMTLSGGEPLMQPEFTLSLLREGKNRGLHICMETCGYAPAEVILEASGYVDIFLYDCKVFDSEMHRLYTGVGNERILKNLELLEEKGSEIVLRCPMIPGVNVNDAHIEAIGKAACENRRVTEIDLLPYHPLGIGKAERLGKTASYGRKEFLEKKELEKYRDRLREITGKKVVL